MILKYAYILFSFLFVLSVILGKLFIFGKRDASFISDYCAGMAVLLGAYVLLSLVYVFVFPSNLAKCIMFFFAVSPFLIGFFATYNTEKFFTALQILIVCGSVAYII